VYDSLHSKKLDFHLTRPYFVKFDSLFYTLNNVSKDEVVLKLTSLQTEIENSILSNDSKYKLTSTVDVAKGSITLWSGGTSRSIRVGNLIGACLQDIATYDCIMAEANSMGDSQLCRKSCS